MEELKRLNQALSIFLAGEGQLETDILSTSHDDAVSAAKSAISSLVQIGLSDLVTKSDEKCPTNELQGGEGPTPTDSAQATQIRKLGQALKGHDASTQARIWNNLAILVLPHLAQGIVTLQACVLAHQPQDVSQSSPLPQLFPLAAFALNELNDLFQVFSTSLDGLDNAILSLFIDNVFMWTHKIPSFIPHPSLSMIR